MKQTGTNNTLKLKVTTDKRLFISDFEIYAGKM